jgi:hypothetical protein
MEDRIRHRSAAWVARVLAASIVAPALGAPSQSVIQLIQQTHQF